MKLSIALDDRDHAILICDEDHNDIAEFYHSDHATVSQSYETALALAKQLVEANNGVAQASPEPLREGCILCANGNDLLEGEQCAGCQREGHAVGLRAAVIKARGRAEPPSSPVHFAKAVTKPSPKCLCCEEVDVANDGDECKICRTTYALSSTNQERPMFEDEMTEDHATATEAEYLRVTTQEIEEEKLARAKAEVAGLVGWAASLPSTNHAGGE